MKILENFDSEIKKKKEDASNAKNLEPEINKNIEESRELNRITNEILKKIEENIEKSKFQTQETSYQTGPIFSVNF